MTAADTAGSTEPLLLAHADFTKFTAYLENSAADPRLSPVRTHSPAMPARATTTRPTGR
jgi:hypothetical protein